MKPVMLRAAVAFALLGWLFAAQAQQAKDDHDKRGIVRYMQVVPEVTQLPDMAAAMNVAKSLL